MKNCLIVIDMQKCFINNIRDEDLIETSCEYINHVANIIRSSNGRVVHIRDIEALEELGADKIDFIPQVDIADEDLKFDKMEPNAFWKTDLEATLKSLGVETVIIAGFSAEHCVTFTYNGALERGFNSLILQNGILSLKNSNILSVYKHRNIISYPAVELICSK